MIHLSDLWQLRLSAANYYQPANTTSLPAQDSTDVLLVHSLALISFVNPHVTLISTQYPTEAVAIVTAVVMMDVAMLRPRTIVISVMTTIVTLVLTILQEIVQIVLASAY